MLCSKPSKKQKLRPDTVAIKYLKIAILCCLFIGKSVFAIAHDIDSPIEDSRCDILTRDNFKELKEIIQTMGKDDLLALDVDHVLIMPIDEDSLNRNPYRKKLWENLQAKYGHEQAKIYYGIVALKAQWRLVDPDILVVMEQLKTKGIPAIAITSIYTGKYGTIESVEDWRIEQLEKKGLNFARFCPREFNQHLKLSEVQSEDGTALVKNGVVFTARNDKGMVLEIIFKKTGYIPRKIVFVDDDLKYLQGVCSLTKRLGIPFYGIHYNAVERMQPSLISERIEDLRMYVLEHDKKWLNYDEVGQLILK